MSSPERCLPPKRRWDLPLNLRPPPSSLAVLRGENLYPSNPRLWGTFGDPIYSPQRHQSLQDHVEGGFPLAHDDDGAEVDGETGATRAATQLAVLEKTVASTQGGDGALPAKKRRRDDSRHSARSGTPAPAAALDDSPLTDLDDLPTPRYFHNDTDASVNSEDLRRAKDNARGKRRARSASPSATSSDYDSHASMLDGIDEGWDEEDKNRLPVDASIAPGEIFKLKGVCSTGYEIEEEPSEGLNAFIAREMAERSPVEDADVGFVRRKKKGKRVYHPVAVDQLMGRENAPAKKHPTLVLIRFSGARSRNSVQRTVRRVLPLARAIRRKYVVDNPTPARSKKRKVSPSVQLGTSPLKPEDDAANLCVFVKTSKATADPFRWGRGPPQVPPEYGGKEFIRRIKDSREPPASIIIIGAAGFTVKKTALVRFIKLIPTECALFFTLRSGKYVIHVDHDLFLDALEGRKSDKLHRGLVGEMALQETSRKNQSKAVKEITAAGERMRHPKAGAPSHRHDEHGQSLCYTPNCPERQAAYTGGYCMGCAADRPTCDHKDENGDRCKNLAAFDNGQRCTQHRFATEQCKACGKLFKKLPRLGMCHSCQPQEYKDQRQERQNAARREKKAQQKRLVVPDSEEDGNEGDDES